MNNRNVPQSCAKNTRKLLKETRLSCLPSAAKKRVNAPLCAGCNQSFTPAPEAVFDDLRVCQSCLRIYAAVDAEITARADRKTERNRRDALAKFAGGFCR